MSGSKHDWLLLGVGISPIALNVVSIRSGSASFGYASFERSENPLIFWLVIIVTIATGAAGIVFALGDLFGIAAITKFAH